MAAWWGLSFLRLVAGLLLGMGLCLWVLRRALTPVLERHLLLALGLSATGLSLLAAIQAQAIWSSVAGWSVAGALLVVGLACIGTAWREARVV
jgi:hypothetical protein